MIENHFESSFRQVGEQITDLRKQSQNAFRNLCKVSGVT